MKENWVAVTGYEGIYAVSDQGRIRPLVHRPRSRRVAYLKGTVRPDGYLCVGLVDAAGVQTNQLVHRVVLRAFAGEPEGRQGAHLNGNKADNRLANLMWATPAVNHSHKKLHGTATTGERNGAAKLTEETVARIRDEFIPRSRTRGSTALGKKYGVSPGHICAIVNRELWNHV